jgi:hypothetical protein
MPDAMRILKTEDDGAAISSVGHASSLQNAMHHGQTLRESIAKLRITSFLPGLHQITINEFCRGFHQCLPILLNF